jgi:hypothetical protein
MFARRTVGSMRVDGDVNMIAELADFSAADRLSDYFVHIRKYAATKLQKHGFT